jgi:hypothetical protein
MRRAIDQYTLEHQAPPQSLQDLVESHYLTALSIYPTARQRATVELSPEASVVGIAYVHSSSAKISTHQTRCDSW